MRSPSRGSAKRTGRIADVSGLVEGFFEEWPTSSSSRGDVAQQTESPTDTQSMSEVVLLRRPILQPMHSPIEDWLCRDSELDIAKQSLVAFRKQNEPTLEHGPPI